MIIFNYLNREVLKSTTAVLAVLLIVFVSQEFVGILADATEGKIPARLVFELLSYNLPALIALLLPLSMFLGILLGVSRLYAESEMTVLKACGVSEWYAVRVILFQALLAAMLAGALSLWWGPLALEQEYQAREQAAADVRMVTLVPGKFQSAGSGAVLMVDQIQEGGDRLQQIFFAEDGKRAGDPGSVVVAEEGVFHERDDGQLILELRNGSRYQGEPGVASFEKQRFDSYRLVLQDQSITPRKRKEKALSVPQLLAQGDDDALAELHWRLAIPLSIPLMTLIAVPMAAVNPRQGKFAKLVPAFMLYLGYYVLLLTARNALEDGKLPQVLGLWWVHGLTLLIGFLLIIRGRPIGGLVRLWWLSRGSKSA